MRAAGRRLHRCERGQVLYLTLALMLILVVFVILLSNVIYLAVLKLRAQNLADNLALSATTLKARVLNRVSDANAVLEFVALQGGRIRFSPYATPIDMWAGQGAMGSAYAMVETALAEYNLRRLERVQGLLTTQGIDLRRVKVGLLPLAGAIGGPGFSRADQMQLAQLYQQADIREYIAAEIQVVMTHFVPPDPVPKPLPDLCLKTTAFAPRHTPWATQTRVEWRTASSLIGSRWLPVSLPDIVTRARAEAYDDPVVPHTTWGHRWRVRLVPVDAGADLELRRQMETREKSWAR